MKNQKKNMKIREGRPLGTGNLRGKTCKMCF